MSFLFAVFIFMGIELVFLSNDFKMYGVVGIVISGVAIFFNVSLLIRAIMSLRFYKRYDLYYQVLKFKNIELISDLATYSKLPEEIVVKDLLNAVEEKLIPQGHFGEENIFFMVSDEIFDKYKARKNVYDHYFRKLLEERNRMSERTEDMEKIMRKGQHYIDKIKESNAIIKDKVISEKLTRMEQLVQMIFCEVDINPNQLDKLGLFINYYLPTTEKLLETYMDISDKQIKGKSLMKTKSDIEKALDTMIGAFEGILDKFYQEKEIDIAGDISALEMMIHQES
jgi:hypothetical protein